MLTEKLKEAQKEYMLGYNHVKELLVDIFDPKEPKDDFRSAVHLTRAKADVRSESFMRDLGHDVAWTYYHLRYPIRAYKYRRHLKRK